MAEKIGRYEILREIGRGRAAVVYLAHDPNFQREVAVKVALRNAAEDPALLEAFLRDARAVVSLEHPALVPVYDFGEADGRPFLVMRHLAGGSLAERIRRGPFSIAEAATVLQRIGAALDAAHAKGIVHRNLKPSNILFDSSGEAFLADFGIALTSETAVSPAGSTVLGTPAYMSPEQIRGDAKIDGRADVYALGIILYEMLTGTPPFQAETPAQVMMMHLTNPLPPLPERRADLPDSVKNLLIRATAKEPEFRFPHASEIGSMLAVIAASQMGPGTRYSQTDILLQETSITRVDLDSNREEQYGALLKKQAARSAPPEPPRNRNGWLQAGAAVAVLAAVIGAVALIAGSLRGGAHPATQTPSAAPTVTAVPAPTVAIFLRKSAPANAAFAPINPTLSWNAGGGSINYEYCFDTTDNNACDGSWVSAESPATAPLSGLKDNATYYWQVRIQSGGGFIYGDDGAWWSFTARNQTFADVPITDKAWPYIEAFYNAKIAGGCVTDPLSFCPQKPLTRAEVAILLLRLKYGSDYIPPAATGKVFADVPKTHLAAAWIEQLYADRITTGCGVNPLIYCPEQELPRDAAAVFLLRTKNGSKYVPPAAGHIFSDLPVKGKEWMEPWIEQLYREVDAAACATNPLRYCPSQSLMRAQAAELFVLFFQIPLQ